MTTCSQLADQIFNKCSGRISLEPEAKTRVIDYILKYLAAMKRREEVVVHLTDERLFKSLQVSKEDGKALMEKINSEIERLSKSGERCK